MSDARAAKRLPRVAVLLSTFNGARYLGEQMQSIASQTGVEVLLHARDDGSRDGTPRLLRDHASRWPALASVDAGENLGVARSFLGLLRGAPGRAEYFAFCDQDDVWLPDKLQRAVAAIADESGPALYCSNVTLVDQALAPIGTGPGDADTRFEHVLFENIAFGCTVVMNRAARDRIVAHDPGTDTVMHDWWCALVVSAFGKVCYDPRPGVLYRQHGGNVVGQQSPITQATRELSRFMRGPRSFYRVHAQASALLRLYGDDLPGPQRSRVARLVASKAGLASRLSYALTGPVLRRRAIDATVVRALIAAGWY